jgi:hypothetical protein
MDLDTSHFDRDLLPAPPIFEKFPALGGTERSRKNDARNKARNIAPDPSDNRELRKSLHSNLTLYPDRIILTYSTGERAMVYYLFDSPASAINHVCNIEPQPRFFYMVEPNRPVRAYFDLERPRLGMTDGEFFRLARRVVVYFDAYVTAIHAGLRRQVHITPRWYFYSASVSEKLSMHAHGDITFLNVKELRRVVEAFHELLRWMADNSFAQAASLFFPAANGTSKCIVDPGVYSDGRAFRLPYNSKWAAGSNPLMPVMCEREMTAAEHIAAAFIHPNKLIHPAHCVENLVPPCPDNFRNRAFNFLTSSVQWPLADADALDRAMYDFAVVCEPAFLKLQTEVPVQQWHFGGKDHVSPILIVEPPQGVHPRPIVDLGTSALAVASVKRSQWLAAMVTMLQACEDAETTRVRMPLIASASFAASLARPSWKERMSIVHPQTQVSWTELQQPDDTNIPSDLAAEVAFAWLYIRLLFSDRFLSEADGRIAVEHASESAAPPPSDFFAQLAYEDERKKVGSRNKSAIDAGALHRLLSWPGDENDVDEALTRPIALDAHETLQKYELFRKLPGHILFTPSQLVTLDKIAHLAEHDPLAASAPGHPMDARHEPEVCAAFADYCMW